MPDCERLEGCPYFHDRLKDLEAIQEVMKNKYCRGDNSQCARHIVACAIGKENVPPTLVPSQVEKAEEIIAKQKGELR